MTNILVTGSLAYDQISVFKGRFQDHILPHKIHELSVVFSVEDMQVNYGGTAANLAYNLMLLGETSIIVGSLGKDGDDYLYYLKGLGLDTKYIRKSSDLLTAMATIMTDTESNQITSFYVGAMAESVELDLNDIKEAIFMTIIAPNDIPAMLKARQYCLERNIKFIADPGQRIPAFTKDELKEFIKDSYALVVNDYELDLISSQIDWEEKDILEKAEFLIVTYGDEGSKIYCQDGGIIKIPAYSAQRVVDPTGSGDAYRAGLLYGLKSGFSIEKSACIGSWLASKCVEEKGTQNHKISRIEFEKFIQSL